MESAFDPRTFPSLPRLSGLVLSPDGRSLVAGVARPGPDGRSFRTSLWDLDPAGERAPRRLTRGAKGEQSACFAWDGTLLFLAARPDPEAEDPDDEPKPALWALPAGGGEARLLAAPPGGVAAVTAARCADRVVLGAPVAPAAEDLEEDAELAQRRKDAGVTAQLFSTYPIRYWDHWLGPRRPALWRLTGDLPTHSGDDPLAVVARNDGAALEDASFDLGPDGAVLVTTWLRTDEPDLTQRVHDLVTVDLATGRRSVLVADDHSYSDVQVSPDGRRVAAVRTDLGSPDEATWSQLVVVDLEDGAVQVVAPDLEVWPASPRWLPDGGGVVVAADEDGHRPLFRIDLADGAVTRLTAEGAYTDVCIAPDGANVYALRSSMVRPPHPVVLDPAAPDQDPRELPSPAADVAGPGRVERVSTTAEDGTTIGSWLVLPPAPDGPAPLVVFIHGGPLGSWNGWHWRWNPHVLAAAGYAVLAPDPALSTGYGRAMLERGWGRWGREPYTDVLAAVDAVVERDDVDAERTAAMGGSFGGYMANWVAGHTDRFRAVVTHASLWQLEGFHGATDVGVAWERQFGDPYRDPSRYREHSPHRFVADIHTPMLVIHGERDFRVPLGEALQLWTDLSRHRVEAQFLYFPDENHWVLKPQNVTLWYETVLAFLDHHVRDLPWQRPDLL